MPMLSTEVLSELVATSGRYLQWEMPIPCGNINEDCFSIREADGRQIQVVDSGGGRAVGDLLRQKLIHKDEVASRQGSWIFRPIDRAT
jgi:hypothetical protein